MNYQYIRQSKYKKGFIAPLLLALIALLVLGGGAYVYVQNNPSNHGATEGSNIQATSTIQTSSKVVIYAPKQAANWVTIVSSRGGFSFKVPRGFVTATSSPFDAQNGIDSRLNVGENYFKSIGVEGRVSSEWNVISGFAGTGCSIVSYGMKGSATSTNITRVGDLSFYKITESDGCGAGTCGDRVRYVQPVTSNSCRYIEFDHYWHNPGGYATLSVDDLNKMSENTTKVDENMKGIIPAIINTIQMSVVGHYTSAKIKNSTTFLFIDNSGKNWDVDYQNASFSQFSYSYGRVHGTDGLLSTILQDWLKDQQHVGDPEAVISEGPGSITIIGTLDANGVLVASSIKVDGQ